MDTKRNHFTSLSRQDMCDPTMGFATAAIMIMQAKSQQDAAMAQAEATNEAFEKNNQLQNEAYTKDMEMYWNEELALQQQMHQNAEDAVEAKLDSMIEAQEQRSSLVVANLESLGGGQSPDRQLGLLRRQMSNRLQDIDDQFQRGAASLKGEAKVVQHDKTSRRYSAIGQINSMQRDPGLTSHERWIGMAGAGIKGYSMGSSGGKTKDPRTVSYKPTATQSGARQTAMSNIYSGASGGGAR